VELISLATTAVALLSPYLVKAGEKAAEKIGEKMPEAVSKLWNTITAKFKGNPAAETAVNDLVAKPDDEDNQAAFRKELRKLLEAEPAFAAELGGLLDKVQHEAGDTITVTGSGAAATRGGVAAGEHGIAVGHDLQGGIHQTPSERQR
jgi:hypothetical protein